jgi:beta-phosphoglucomutase
MTLKAVLFDFNGVIINDEPIHRQSIDELLLAENLRPQGREFFQVSIGRTDRSCLAELLALRGRSVTAEYLDKLLAQKAIAYRQKLASLGDLPIYPDVAKFLERLKKLGYTLGLVTGAIRSEVEFVLEKSNLQEYFPVIVAGDEIASSKPAPDGYLQAIDLLNQLDPNLQLAARECLVIEDTFPGIKAGQSAGMQVVAIANTYPLHMLQRRANWSIDSFEDLELDRIVATFDR